MNNKYQEDLLNNENDQMYETIFEKMKKNKLQVVIIGSVLFIILLVYILFFSGNSSGEREYTELVVTLCDKALEYERKNEGIIDRNTPGATTYVRLQKLVDANLIDPLIVDPRHKGGIFSKAKYVPLDSYIKLSVASNREVYCDGLED
jgi:hypothetical protein